MPNPSLIAREEETLMAAPTVYVLLVHTSTETAVYGPFESPGAARAWGSGVVVPLTAPAHREVEGGGWGGISQSAFDDLMFALWGP